MAPLEAQVLRMPKSIKTQMPGMIAHRADVHVLVAACLDCAKLF